MPDKRTYKEIHGTTRVGDFLRNIKGAAPELLKLAGSVPGLSGLKSLGEIIENDNALTPEQKELALAQLELDYKEAVMESEERKHNETQVSDRWGYDMQSDNKASKNIRPYTVGYLLIFVSVLIILDSTFEGFDVKAHWVELLSTLTVTAVGGYFVLRETGKAIKNTGLKTRLKDAFKK